MMRLHMTHITSPLIKRLSANLARESLQLAMKPRVSVQIALPIERFAANRAVEVPFLRMNHHVEV